MGPPWLCQLRWARSRSALILQRGCYKKKRRREYGGNHNHMYSIVVIVVQHWCGCAKSGSLCAHIENTTKKLVATSYPQDTPPITCR